MSIPGRSHVLTASRTECVTVSSRAELKEWIGLTDRIYAGDPCFIPPFRQQFVDFYERKAPYFRYGEIEFLSAVRHGRLVGRTTAHTSSKLDAKLGERSLLFGFTEFVDDEAFAVLAAELEARAKTLRATQLFGPVNLLPNQSGGVVTSGYGRRGFIDSPYNPPHYPAAYDAQGFSRVFEGATFICPLRGDERPVEELFPFPDARIEAERLEVRQADRRRVDEQLVFIREMLNASFAQLGYYTEIDAEELAYQVDGLNHLLDERIALYLFKEGRPIAFILCVPDISEFVREIGGNLNLRNQLRLLLRRKRYRREAVAVIKGTVPEEQGRGYMRLLSRELLRNLREAGYETLRGTFIEEENTASASQAEHMAGRPLHGVTFYRRAVG
jgi:GNAT superfamily N-acetyltransferase